MRQHQISLSTSFKRTQHRSQNCVLCFCPKCEMNMKKRQIITILLVLVAAVAGQAKTFKTIKNPETMACVNVNLGELKAREVIFRDTATTVHFTMVYQKEQYFRFAKNSYLMDEDGNRYPLRSAEGIALDAWVQSPESGVTDFTMHFEPLPKKVQIFDFIEGDGT